LRKLFPYTATACQIGDRRLNAVSPQTFLLPHLEQQPLYEGINFTDFAIDEPGAAPLSELNAELLPAHISAFLCPSDGRGEGGNNYRANLGVGPGVFDASQTSLCPDPSNGTGAFVNGRSVRTAEFLDGLAHTVLFSERVKGDGDPDHYDAWADVFFSPRTCLLRDVIKTCSEASSSRGHDSLFGETWLLGGWRHTWYNHVFGPNSVVRDCMERGALGGGYGAYTARSYHSGGVNACNADGAVIFVAESIDLNVWRALSTRAGDGDW
jgi:hypothetical protein